MGMCVLYECSAVWLLLLCNCFCFCEVFAFAIEFASFVCLRICLRMCRERVCEDCEFCVFCFCFSSGYLSPVIFHRNLVPLLFHILPLDVWSFVLFRHVPPPFTTQFCQGSDSSFWFFAGHFFAEISHE